MLRSKFMALNKAKELICKLELAYLDLPRPALRTLEAPEVAMQSER